MKVLLTLLMFFVAATMAIAQPWGDTIGSTHYVYQSNGSTGNRIAVTDSNHIYVCWMGALSYPPPPRHVYFSHRDENGNWLEGGCQVDVRPAYGSAGFPTLDIYQGYRAAIAYHYTDASPYTVRLAIDDADFPGFCIFERYDVPNLLGGAEFIWPQVAVDRNDKIHYVMTEPTDGAGDPQRIIYTRSNDDGQNWTEVAVVDTVMTISCIVVASPVSDRVAVCYTHPNDFDTQWNNEIFYIVSEDGQNWDWQNGKIQVTDYEASGSEHRAYSEVEGLFDYDDVFHITWPTSIFDSTVTSNEAWLWHYDEVSDTIILVAHNPDTLDTPPWQLSIAKVSLSRSENMLFASWTQFAEGDTSVEGVANGDLYISRSSNNGLTWAEPENITNTPSPNCLAGNCMSEIFPSAAEKADSLPHITYIFDPGGPGALVMYLGPDHLVGIDDDKAGPPVTFALSQNYPNPFNAATTIEYNLPQKSFVTIDIYDILGRRVESLISEEQQAGRHSVIWQADDMPSGIYFFNMTAADFSQTRKMILLK